MEELVIGLDIGTTSVKGVAFDLHGKVKVEAEKLIDTYYPNPAYVEQNPEEVEESARQVLKQVFQGIVEDKIAAIGISCAMHSLICVDEKGNPLSNMLIWSDGRSSELVKSLDPAIKQTIYSKTGTPIHPMSPFMKLMWMKENQYPAYQAASFFMSMKEYLLYKWSKQRIIDYSMASATGLMDIHTLDWDGEALALTGIERSQLSKIVAPTTVVEGIDEEIKADMNWPASVPLVIGAADGQLANLGDGAIKPGEVAISVGTSGAIRQLISGQRVNDNGETFSYAFTKDTSIIGGPTNNGGIALQWLKNVMEFEGTHQEFLEGAETIAPGAEGLLFIPYVNGERAPVWNQQARGNFYGLNMIHKRPHLVRAVLEGIVFNLYKISQSVEEIAGPPTTISANGGLTKSPLWVQILADVFGKPVQIADTHHGAAWGAGWTALVGMEKAASFEQIKENIPIKQIIEPNMENHQQYQTIVNKYHKLNEAIVPFF